MIGYNDKNIITDVVFFKSEDKMFRNENKYMISFAQEEYLKMHLQELCESDSHTDVTNRYYIRSLYFDDYDSSAYSDNARGVDNRTKYRIRIYNCDSSVIHLECKQKVNGKIHKEKAVITREFCQKLMEDRGEELEYPTANLLINRFLYLYHTQYLRPRVIVEYEREPYVHPDGDVRITIDRNISFSEDVEHFFEKDIFMQPILPTGQNLLEVKYTEFLPEFIKDTLDIKHMQRITFSKYYLCEKFRRGKGV